MEAPRISEETARQFLSRIASAIGEKPFKPHPFFTSGHAQTLASYAWPRRRSLKADDEERFFEINAETRLLAHCRWQPNPQDHPTLVLWHGMEGSTSSLYMLAIAQKSFLAGFNVVRMNSATAVELNT